MVTRTQTKVGKYGIEITGDGWIEFHDLKAKGVITEPPYDNAVFWLGAIGYCIEDLAYSYNTIARISSTSFTDMGVECRLFADFDAIYCRHRDLNNWYGVYMDADWATEDHQIRKKVAGTETTLATEAVDLGKYWYWVLFETVGTTLNSYRAPDPLSPVPETPTLSVTDTDIADGRFGVKHFGHGAYGLCGLFYFFRAPRSHARKPIAYFEVPITGSGTSEDPYRPDMPEEVTVVKKFEVLDPKRYRILREVLKHHLKYVNERFVNMLAEALGFIRTYEKVNKLACTWSALIPTDKNGKPKDSVCIVRIFEVRDPRVLEALKEKRARKLSREEAIRRAKQMDDKLHDYDLEHIKDEDEAKKKAREYVEWRRKQFRVEMSEKVAQHYLMTYKGW